MLIKRVELLADDRPYQCGKCLKMRVETGTEPMCWSKPCRTSKFQFDEVANYINFWASIWRSEKLIAHGLGRKILKAADAMDPETLEIFVLLDSHLENSKKDK